MSELNIDTVKKIAHLSRLGIAESDLAQYRDDLAHILAMVAQMDQVETTGVQPMAHPFDQVQTLREDIVTESDQRDILMQNAPAQADHLFLVPKVIE